MKKLIVLRRLSQLFFLGVFLYILWATTYPLKSKLAPELFFNFDPLIIFTTSLAQRVILAGMLASLAMVLLTAILGRFFCGWMCPFGTMIDWLGFLNKARSIKNSLKFRSFRFIKFFILLAIIIFAIFKIQIAWIFDPIVIAARFVSLNLIPFITSLTNNIFIWLIKTFGLYGGFLDFYRGLKSSVLGINIYYFSHSLVIFIFFALVCSFSLFIARFWCRNLCPMGAIYSGIARFSWLRRVVTEKCTRCSICQKRCRMAAIDDGPRYKKAECVLCMDCIYDCPAKATSFKFTSLKTEDKVAEGVNSASKISRKDFLIFLCASILPKSLLATNRKEIFSSRALIRPPASLAEEDFLNRCVRCANCMKACPTNGLQPVSFETGLKGIWTPQLIPEVGYCEYRCTLCGSICPTGAITKISPERKLKTHLGLAKIDRNICIPWSQNKECIVCQEHCPISDKAIKIKESSIANKIIMRPYVDEELCVGCGICQNKCPTRPLRAIRVAAERADRF